MEHYLLIETTSNIDWQGQSEERSCQKKTENKSRSDREPAFREKKLFKRKSLGSSRQINICLGITWILTANPTMKIKQLEINNLSP